jgi:hypothetical protein
MTELKIYLNPLTDKNAQLVTACIVQLADSVSFKGSASNKLCGGLTVSSFNKSPTDTIHAKRYQQGEEKTATLKMTKKMV